jgi:hypothetical protein
MVEKLFAALGLALCIAALVGMLLGPRRTHRWRARLTYSLGWYQRRSAAQSEAAQAIARARRAQVEREGNVYRPKSFNGPPPEDKLH